MIVATLLLASLCEARSIIRTTSYTGYRSSVQCLVDDDERTPPSPLSLTLQLLPVAVSVAAGEPWFASAYLPLAAIGYSAGANPSASLVLATLLYAAGTPLSEAPHVLLPLACVLNLGIAAAIFSLEDNTMLLTGEQPPDFKDDFAAFDRRLDDRLKGRGKRD